MKLSDTQQEVVGQLRKSRAGDGLVTFLRERRAQVEKAWPQSATARQLRIFQGRAAELDDLIKLFDPSQKRQGE